ncbi:MAG: polymorphic toxin-type HINT domain-containing protein [bacterium]
MKKNVEASKKFFTLKHLIPAVAVITLIALLAGAIHFLPPFSPNSNKGTKIIPSNQFSSLIINPAFAMDNFELQPEKMDSAGVDENAVYVLSSKEELDAELIKENIILNPKVDFDIEKVSSTQWKIIPKEELSPNTILKVSLNATYYNESGEMQKRDYNWAYQIKDSFKILTTIPRDTGTYVPTNSGIEITFSHDNFTDFEKYFSITPQVEGRFEKHGRTMVYVSANGLKEATIYTVTVKAGLPLLNSEQKLAEDKVIQFETEGVDRFYNNRYFNIYNKMLEFSSGEKPVVQVYTDETNAQANVKIYKLNSSEEYLKALNYQDQMPWWSYSYNKYVYDTSKLTEFMNLSAPIQKGQYVQFIEFPEKLPIGFYVIDFESNGAKQQAWFQVTDLSAYINITKTQTIVWVNDLFSKQPVSGANVKVAGENSEYNTDNNGIAVFDTLKETTGNSKKAYIEITSGEKKLIIPASGSNNYYRSVNSQDDYWRYLYNDRPKYQPTDTIKFWGMLKSRDGKKIDEKVSITFIKEGYMDYQYQPVFISEQELNLNDLGIYSGEIKLDNIRPDYYTLQLRAGETIITSKYIEISPYAKPAYKLSMTPDRKTALAGENINFSVQASFFEGTPVPNLPLVFNMPEGDYEFVTDENGQAKLTYTKQYYECGEKQVCWPESAWLRIQPQNSELSEITADASVRFFANNRYAKTKATYPEKGKAKLEISAFYLDPQKADVNYWSNDIGNEIAPNTNIKGEVVKIIYEKYQTGASYDFVSKKSYPTYNYSSREEKVDSFKVNSGPNGVYVYVNNIEEETSYYIRLKIFSEDGRYSVANAYLYYYDGEGVNHYYSYYNNYYNFDLEDKTYNVGEKVSADMRQNDASLPDDNGNKYLFLQMQNGLQEYVVSDNSTYSFNFEKRDIPNVNLAGIYFNGSAYFATETNWWGASGNQIKYNTDNSKLNIDIATDKDNYKPGEDIKISLSVKNEKGEPVKSEVNVNVVDEAYYAMMEDTANPMDEIYASVSSGSYVGNYSHKTISDAMSAEGGGCFLSGTKILMADGNVKPIEEIDVNDEIKTIADPLHIKYETGKVVEMFKRTAGEYLIINKILRVTPEHRIYSNNSFVMAGELRRGDWLLDQNGNKVFITSIETKKEIVKVYNFKVEPQHTYIADGFYVHNDKGGVREILLDAPLFASVATDSNGKGEVAFTLPDNITSWRVTTQAISGNLEIGTAVGNVNVSLPVFVDATIGNEYLTEDQPIARLRAYGTSLNSDDDAIFNLKAESLGIEKSEDFMTKAFQPAFINLPKFTAGKHDITYNVSTTKGNDALKLPIDVISSRLSKLESTTQTLTTDTKMDVDSDDLITVILGDINRIQLYDPLERLCWSWTDRIDQAVARKKSRELLNELFGEDYSIPQTSAYLYQQENGGIALLPYSSEDLELTAKLAGTAADEFDKISLEQYFLNIFNNKDSNQEEISLSLYGLASLDVSVLPMLNNWTARDDLTVKEKLYAALSFHKLGADEKARSIYHDVAKEYGQQKLPSIKISIDENEERTKELTSLTAVLASAINAPEKNGYWNYVNTSNGARDAVIDLEKIAYIKEAAKHMNNSSAKIIYEMDGKEHTVDLSNSHVYSFTATADQINSIKFKEVKGNVGITTITVAPLEQEIQKEDASISIRKEFYVNGVKTNNFKENDDIEIRLYPSIGGNALNGSYQITDILPSGLLPVIKYYYGNYSNGCHRWYPYNTDGQKVKYIIYKGWNTNCGNYISYLARVKTKGEYKVEPATIQSLVNPQYINYENGSSIITVE